MKHTRAINLAACVLVFAAAVVTAQQQQQSLRQDSHNDLRGVKKVFIDTRHLSKLTSRKSGDSLEAKFHESITKELRAKLPSLEIVDSPEKASVHLEFKLKGQHAEGSDGPVEKRRTSGVPIRVGRVGIGGDSGVTLVFVGTVSKVLDDYRTQVLLSSEYWATSIFGVKPHVKFVKDFVKAYEQAN